jgi:hypothetical protein
MTKKITKKAPQTVAAKTPERNAQDRIDYARENIEDATSSIASLREILELNKQSLILGMLQQAMERKPEDVSVGDLHIDLVFKLAFLCTPEQVAAAIEATLHPEPAAVAGEMPEPEAQPQ